MAVHLPRRQLPVCQRGRNGYARSAHADWALLDPLQAARCHLRVAVAQRLTLLVRADTRQLRHALPRWRLLPARRLVARVVRSRREHTAPTAGRPLGDRLARLRGHADSRRAAALHLGAAWDTGHHRALALYRLRAGRVTARLTWPRAASALL